MIESIINDKRLLRVCMLYEMLQNRPIFESYLNFCETLQCPELDYREFEFWYYRLQRGLTDFDYDMSEVLDNKPTLSDMPMDVVGRVLGNLNYKTHLVLRKVSKPLRQIVDQRPPPYKSIGLSITGHEATLSFDGRAVRQQPVEAAIRDLKCAVQHPRVQLEELKIRTVFYSMWEDEKKREMESRMKIAEGLKDVLTTLPHRQTLDVKSLEMQVKTTDEILAVLAHLTPGVLETIRIEHSRIESSYAYARRVATPRLAMKPIIKLEQWQRAKHLDMDRFTVQFPIDNISHFWRMSIRFSSLPMEQLKVLRDALLNEPNFESLDLETSKKIDIDSIDEHLGAGVPHGRPTSYYRHYPVPDSDEHLLQVYSDPKTVKICRILKAARIWI